MEQDRGWQERVRAAHAAGVDRNMDLAPFDPAS